MGAFSLFLRLQLRLTIPASVGIIQQAYFGRKKVPQTTPDEDAALSMLRENPEVLKLLLAMRK